MRAFPLISFNMLPALKSRLTLFSLLFFWGLTIKAQDPVVTVRFANPEFDYATQVYTLDVEFQSDIEGKELFGMNVRFFYPDTILEFISFGEFDPNYGPMIPNPPIITTGNSSSGTILFGFAGPQEYLNGAVQKSGTGHLYLSTTGWTKVFNASFHVDDPGSIDIESFCPPVIWDLNEQKNCGIAAGIVITIVNGGGSAPSVEDCSQFNWQYDGVPGYPHGYPLATDCISTMEPIIVPGNNLLQNITVLSGQANCYDATQTITTAGNGTTFIVEPGANANLIAGVNILMLDGTLVQSGGEFLAAISTNGVYCAGLESAIVTNPPLEEQSTELAGNFSENREVKIFPNPTSGKFTLLLDQSVTDQECQIQVTGIMGNLALFRKMEGSDRFEFDLSGQNPGIYLVRVIRGEKVDNMRLIKN